MLWCAGVQMKVAAVVALLVAAIYGGTLAFDSNVRRQRREAAAIRLAGSRTAFSIGVAFAHVRYKVSGHCPPTEKAAFLYGVRVCLSDKLDADETAMLHDCWECSPTGTHSPACQRMAEAIARDNVYDDPCVNE